MNINMKKILSVLLVLLLLVGCGSSNDEGKITIIDGDFAEMNIATHMAKMLIESNTDHEVVIKPFMAYNLAFDRLTQGEDDILASYDGTLLATFLRKDPSEVPEGIDLYDFANAQAEESDVKLLDKWGHQNTYTVAVTKELAAKHNLVTVSDLIPIASELRFAAEHAFFEEEGTVRYKPFTEYYGLDFSDFHSIDIGLKYTAIASDNMDVTLVNSSDGLNKKYELVILEDDQVFFPEYYMAYLVRDELEAEFPGIEDALNKVSNQFTVEKMIELNYLVDVEGQSAKDVAYDYLLEEGFIQ